MSYDAEEVMDSRPVDQDVDQPRMALGFGEVGDVWIVRTAEAGRQTQAFKPMEAGREYMRGEEVKSVLNNDERSVIDKDRRRR